MMLPNRTSDFTRIPSELRRPICFEKKENPGMDNFLDLGIENYTFLDEVPNVATNDQVIDGLWKMYFDGSYSKNGFGIGIVIESHDAKMYPHDFKLQFECTNNEALSTRL